MKWFEHMLAHESKSILVIGDAMCDTNVYGRVGLCQDDCEKFVEDSRITVPGGAANAAKSLKHWNCTVIFDYPIGERVPIKTRFIADNKIVFRHDVEMLDNDYVKYREHMLYSLRRGRFAGVLISDYDKGTMDAKFIREVIGECNLQRIYCVADAKREPSTYTGAIIKCNYPYSIKYGQYDVCTYGAKMPSLHGDTVDASTYPIRVLNHVGAGDCFGAHLLLALVYGVPIYYACVIAHSAGRVYVQHLDNSPPQPSEIQRDLA